MPRPEASLVVAGLDASGIGLLQIDPLTRRIVGANAAFCRLIGYRSRQLHGLEVERLNPPDAAFDETVFAAALASRKAFHRERPLVRRDGSILWVHLSGHVVRDPTDRPVQLLAIVQDITERRRLHMALQEHEAHLGFVMRLNDLMRRFDDPAVLTAQAARLLGEFVGADRVGYAEDQGDGESIAVTGHYTAGVPGIVGRYRYDDYGPALLKAFREGRTVVRPDIANDRTLSEAEKQAHATLQLGATVNVPLLQGGRLHAVFFVHSRTARHWTPAEVALFEDVAQRLRADLERARAERSQGAAQRRERERIAQELHDDLQQRQALVLLESAAARSVAGAAPSGAREALIRIDEQVKAAITSTRRIIRGLKPPDLETLGLREALRQLAAQFAATGAFVCKVDTRPLSPADEAAIDAVAIPMYRVTQEALNNVVKHARASRVRIALRRLSRAGLCLSIADDGVGWASPAPPSGGLGLAGMAERVRAAGGTLHLRSRPGRGTTVEVRWPSKVSGPSPA